MYAYNIWSGGIIDRLKQVPLVLILVLTRVY